MSTRCNIHFVNGVSQEPIASLFAGDRTIRANVYRHFDGYPDGVLPDLKSFFAEVKKQTSDTRFDDPTYLAAKYVVWQAQQYSRSGKPLDFLGLGVVMKDAPDGEYIYTVHCIDADTAPVVTYTPL